MTNEPVLHMSPDLNGLTAIWWEFGDITVPPLGWTEDGPKLLGYWAVQLRQVSEGQLGVLYFMEGSYEIRLFPTSDGLLTVQLCVAHSIEQEFNGLPLDSLLLAVLTALDSYVAADGTPNRIDAIRAHLIKTREKIAFR